MMELAVKTVLFIGAAVILELLIIGVYQKKKYRKERVIWMKKRLENSSLSSKESEWDINPQKR